MASLRPIKPPVGAGGKKKPVQPRRPLEMPNFPKPSMLRSNQEQYQNRDQARKSDRMKPPVGAGPKPRPVKPRPRIEEVQMPTRKGGPKKAQVKAPVKKQQNPVDSLMRGLSRPKPKNPSPSERAGKGRMSGIVRPSMNNARPPANRRTRPVQPPQRRGMR